MAGETNVQPYAGTHRPWDEVIEPVAGGPLKEGFAVMEWRDAQGCRVTGYRYPDGRLIGSRIALSPAEQTAVNAIKAAKAAEETTTANFKASIISLAQLVRDNTATAAQQRQLLVKLSRAVLQLYSDAP